ncbi:TetR family transcriptional regulator [Halostella sp. JP-L12]|uniref:TetR/AcrR family transcriptional regulator n=1 Tax=Halostella TaxID=1843185 RepID=UPI000EF7B992|nr:MULTISPECIES: TetR/AcrR family transcriptional regulator [Halostella]NHN48427.1 TetR family transcriptional regulator [Halostella sp. JP-L12]
MGTDLFEDAPDDTRAAIMQATYRALCEHGYAGLTIQRIGDEFSKSKSLLYHHYDGKDDLLLDFLSFMLDRYRETVPRWESEDPEPRLRSLIDYVVPVDIDDERREFRKAMVELRAQAAHDEAYRDHFTESDRFFRSEVAKVVAEGIERGDFRDVDPDAAAAHLQTTFEGAMVRGATTEFGDEAAAVREELHRYVDRLVAEDDE